MGSIAMRDVQDITDSIPAARQLFDEASDILGYDLLKVCIEGAKQNVSHHASVWRA